MPLSPQSTYETIHAMMDAALSDFIKQGTLVLAAHDRERILHY